MTRFPILAAVLAASVANAADLAPCPTGPCQSCRCVEQNKCNAATCQPHRPPLRIACGCPSCDCPGCECESPLHSVQFQLSPQNGCPSCNAGTCPAPAKAATKPVSYTSPEYAAIEAKVKAGETVWATVDGTVPGLKAGYYKFFKGSDGKNMMQLHTIPVQVVYGFGAFGGTCGAGGCSSCR